MRSPWAWIQNLLRRGPDPRQIERFQLPYPVSGLNLTPDDILSLGAVWACIDSIARAIGVCPWGVYLGAPGSTGPRELAETDPLLWVLNTRPNPEMTAIGFREAMLFQAVPQGNAYAEIVRDLSGRVAELWPLMGDRVRPKRDPNTWALFYEYTEPWGEVKRLEPRDVFHLRGPGLYGLMGDNLIARAAKSMSVAAAQERYSASFFGQGAQPGGILQTPTKLNDESHKRLKEDFADKRKGPENAHKPLILEAGWTWKETGVDPQKSQLVEGRKFSVEEICRWFGVPPHKVQHLEHATFSNIEHQSIEFVQDAVAPWCVRMQQEADYKLIRARMPRHTEIDTSGLLRGDAKTRAEGYAIMRQNGLMSANEIRAKEGMNTIKNGDVLLVQSNLTTIERIIEPPKPPPMLGPGGAPSDDPEEDTDEEAGEPDGFEADTDAGAVARVAFTTIVGGALNRYARRLENRRTDLARRPPSKHQNAEALGTALMDAAREAFRPRLFLELEAAQPFAEIVLGRVLNRGDWVRLAAAVDGGVAPDVAVAALLPDGAIPAACPPPG